MKVHSSHLSLRFYLRDGWTRSALEPLLTKGSIGQQDSMFPDMCYLIPEAWSLFDIDKLCEKATSVVTWKGQTFTGDEMRQYFKEMSW